MYNIVQYISNRTLMKLWKSWPINYGNGWQQNVNLSITYNFLLFYNSKYVSLKSTGGCSNSGTLAHNNYYHWYSYNRNNFVDIRKPPQTYQRNSQRLSHVQKIPCWIQQKITVSWSNHQIFSRDLTNTLYHYYN